MPATGGESRTLGPPDSRVCAVSSRSEVALITGPDLEDYFHGGTLAVMPLDGGAPHPLMNEAYAADFAPNGTDLAVVHGGYGQQLEYPIGHLVYTSPGSVSDVRVSPDGRSVAFVDHPSSSADRGSVALVDGAGTVHRLTQSFIDVRGLAWSPDGREVFFTAAEGGAQSLRAVTLDGAPFRHGRCRRPAPRGHVGRRKDPRGARG
jgi:hypothetical protein